MRGKLEDLYEQEFKCVPTKGLSGFRGCCIWGTCSFNPVRLGWSWLEGNTCVLCSVEWWTGSFHLAVEFQRGIPMLLP